MDSFLPGMEDCESSGVNQYGHPLPPVRTHGVTDGRTSGPGSHSPLPVRPSDPETSVEAAEKISPSIDTLARWAASFVWRFPNSTGAELDRVADCRDTRKLSKRLKDAERLGLIVSGPKRLCEVGGNNAQTWRPAR